MRAQSDVTPSLPTQDVQTLIHELNVYQMELEIQNEELRLAQLEIAHSRDRYSDLYDFAPVGYATLQDDGTILEANLTTCRLLGVDRRFLMGRQLTDWIDRDSQETFYLHRQDVFSTPSKHVCEILMKNASGTSMDIRLESIAIETSQKPVCRTALIDISELKLERTKVEHSEQRFRRLTNAMTQCVYRVQLDHGKILNREQTSSCELFTGYTLEELRKSPNLWMSMIPAEERQLVHHQVAELLKTGFADPIEHRLQLRDGSIKWVLHTLSPEFDPQGELIAYDGMLRDITPRKDAEAELKQLTETLEQRIGERTSEVRLMAEAMSNLGEGVMVTNAQLDSSGPEILYVNKALTKISGYASSELIGQTPRIFQGKLTDPTVKSRLHSDLQAGKSHFCEVINYRKDGTPYFAEIYISPMLGNDGKPTHFIGIHRDISHKKAIEEALHTQLELNASIIRTAQCFILLLDPQGRILRFNRYAELLTGWKAEEVQGLDWFETFVPEEYRDSTKSIFADALSGKPTRGNVTPIRTKNERLRQVEWFDGHLTSTDGSLIGLLCTGQDITARLAAKQNLKESEERLRSILQTAADAIITINERGIIDKVNAATERMFGYNRDELVGQNVKMLMPPPYSAGHDTYLANYLRTGISRIIGTGREVMGLRKDGTVFPISLTVSQVDHLGLFTGIIRDISERRKLQQHVLLAASEEQRRIGQDLHDGVGQELTGLGLMADTLVDLCHTNTTEFAAGSSKVPQIAEKLATGIKRTLNQVRALSRGLVPVQIDPVGLSSALLELAADTSELYGISCHLSHPMPVVVESSEVASHLFRIAQEAITNAVRHGQATRVVITLVRNNQEITLKIKDNGCGIEPAICSEIGQSGTIGSGMGLRSMQYRAWLSGGELSVSAGSEGGTTVTCHLNVNHSDLPA